MTKHPPPDAVADQIPKRGGAAMITLFTSDRNKLNKTFSIKDGEITKHSNARLVTGEARTVEAPDAATLRAVLEGLTPQQAISVGKLKRGNTAHILSGVRTLDNFGYPRAEGWLLWDYDSKFMPDEVRQRVVDLGGPLEAFFHIWPEAREGEYLIVPSSSDGVGGKTTEGRHGYFRIKDVSRSKEVLEALEARAWKAGIGFYALSKVGSLLERSIVDTAVASPERLIFEAAPTLMGVTRTPSATIQHAGVAMDVPTHPDVTQIRAAARQAIKPEAEKAEKVFVEARAKAQGVSPDKVRERLKARVLVDDEVIVGPSGVEMRVKDLLKVRPHGRGMPCPIEGLEYGTTTATFLWGEGYRAPRIVSHAHGKLTVFKFARFEDLPKPADLVSGRIEDMRAAVKTGDLAQRVAVAHRLAQRVPHRMSVDDVVAFVKEERLRERVDWIVAQRKKAVMDRCSLPARKRSHNYRKVDALTPLVGSGVFIVRAPMASGKTQTIGRALKADMAICHRITLVSELARRLGLPHYQTAYIEDQVAVCLPSIVKFEHLQPKVLFVDEIAQCLQFLESRLCSEKVYKAFARLIRDAKTVVVADAHVDPMTLDFIERCRPNERFNIIEMDAKPSDKRAEIFNGPDAVLEGIALELMKGGKVWLATEGAGAALGIGAQFASMGYRVLTITADTKVVGVVEAFLNNPEGEANKYDLIVASPAISSGLSIEKGDFTLGAFIGSGAAIRPEDAVQMMSRVRYLKRFIICIQGSNLAGGLTAAALREGIEATAAMASEAREWMGYDTFCVRVRADNRNAQSEFGAGLFLMLEAEGWTLERKEAPERKRTAKATKAAKEQEIIAVMRAGLPEVPEVLMEKSVLTSEEQYQLTAQRVFTEFGRLTAADVEQWDKGRAVSVRERFEDLTGVSEIEDEAHVTLSSRKFRAERRILLRDLFVGVDLADGTKLSKEICTMLLERIMRRAGVYAAAGIVEQKYAVSWVQKQAKPKNPVGEIAALLKQFGLSTKRSKSVSQLASLVTKRGKSETKTDRENNITLMGFAAMEERLKRRIETALAIEAKEPKFAEGYFSADPMAEKPKLPKRIVLGSGFVIKVAPVPDLTPERPEVCEPMTFEANLPASNGGFDVFEVTKSGEVLKVWDAEWRMSSPMMFAAE